MFDELQGVHWTHVEQPAAQAFFDPMLARPHDAFVLYDMPGIRFRRDRPPDFLEPPDELKRRLVELLDQGIGLVFLHHAVAGWPAWSEHAEIVGGRFLYLPGELRGVPRRDSGYRLRGQRRATVAQQPCVRTRQLLFSREGRARRQDVLERRLGTRTRQRSDRRIKHYRNSPIVYLQCGDDPEAYDNPHYRTLLANAIDWVSSPEARTWAQQRNDNDRRKDN